MASVPMKRFLVIDPTDPAVIDKVAEAMALAETALHLDYDSAPTLSEVIELAFLDLAGDTNCRKGGRT